MAFEENHTKAEDAYLRQACDATAEATVARMFEAIGYRPGMVIVPASRIEKLEAALTPFLKLPIGVINDDPPEMEVYQCHGWPRDQFAVVTVADFRRVRKALDGKDG